MREIWDSREATPLLDFTGKIKGRNWPGGTVTFPAVMEDDGERVMVTKPTFRKPREGEALKPDHHSEVHFAKGYGRWIDCKYCYKTVLPLLLVEHVPGYSGKMLICSNCGSGLQQV